MKYLNKNTAKSGLWFLVKSFTFLFTAIFAFIDIVLGDPDEYDEDEETSAGISPNTNFYLSTAAGKPLTHKNMNNIHNDENW